MNTTIRQPHRPQNQHRNLRKRTSPAKKILTIFLLAAVTVALIYLSLVVIFGFRTKSRTLTMADGSKVTVSFIGFYKDGVPSSGTVSSTRGERGSLSSGKIIYDDGAEYEGEMDEFIRSGQGKLKYANGDVFEGTFVNDEINGYGRFTYYSTADIFEGQIVSGKKTGHGKYIFRDETVYEGNYENDLPNGHGKISYYDGTVYEGNFVDGTRQGYGVIVFEIGDRYEGEFVDGKMHGRGVYTYVCGDVYEGEFTEGQLTGEGKYTWFDGRDYTGKFENGIAIIK